MPDDARIDEKRQDGLILAADFLRFARLRAFTGAAMLSLGGLVDGLGLLLLAPVLEIALHGEGRLPRPLLRFLAPYDQSSRLLALVGLFCLLMALRAAILLARDRTANRLQVEFVEAVRMRLVHGLAAAGWGRITRLNHARMVQALSVDIYQVGIAANSILQVLAALATLLACCMAAILIAPVVGSAAIGFAVLGALLAQPFLARTRRLGRVLTEAHFSLTGRVMTLLNGLKLANAQGLEARFVQAYEAASSAVMRDRLASIALQTSLRTAITTLAALVGALALFIGLAVGHLPAPILLTLLLILSRMSGPALAVQQGVQQITHSLPAYGAILHLQAELGRPSAPPAGRPGRLARPPPGAVITLEAVSFGHDDGVPFLEDVSLTIPTGAFVGLRGPSGSGKTTLLDLAAGVLEPQAGRVLTEFGPLAGPGLKHHRARLAYVAQDPFLFDDTVRANLLWSETALGDAELEAVLDQVGAGPLIARLGQGLDARIGERGALISAGERQRLALARALLRRPSLLLMDEATNALDAASERRVLQKLAEMEPPVTILMAAHGPVSLAFYDLVIELPGACLSAGAKVASARSQVFLPT